MHDTVMAAFLRRQYEEGMALARRSDLVRIAPHGSPADSYLVQFSCTGLVRTGDGAIVEAGDFAVWIAFHASYLRRADPFRVVTWVAPRSVWHPNIAPERRAICIGRLTPGTGLIDLIYQCFEIITWNKVTMREDDALNWAACEWARRNRMLFPVDRRPLVRPAIGIEVRDTAVGGRP